MRIAGFQPLSLLDYPGVVASVVFTQGCPFRCAYCHNPDLIPLTGQAPAWSEDTIVEEMRRHKKIADGVCVTGGEPTIHPDLPAFLARLKGEGFRVKLDTNGVNPAMIDALFRDRLVDYVAMDLKHAWRKYATVTGVEQARATENCERTFRLIQASGIPHEFRTTMYPGMHTEDEIVEISTQLNDGERYAVQPIRYGKTLDERLKTFPQVDTERLENRIRAARPDIELVIRV